MREPSPEMTTKASEALNDPNASEREKSLAGWILAADGTPGQAPMTEAEARALFPGDEFEVRTLSTDAKGQPKRRALAVSWVHEGERFAQSVAIPAGEHGLGRAANTLRHIVDSLKETPAP